MIFPNMREYRKTVLISLLSGAMGALLTILLGTFALSNHTAANLPATKSSWLLLPSSGNSVVDAVDRASPAVVSITVSEKVTSRSLSRLRNPLFEQFFGLTPEDMPQSDGGYEEVGGGSGFLVSADGLIVTNKHVVDEPKAEYSVYTNDGKKHTAKVVALDPVYDIALIKIDGSGYPYLSFGNSDKLRVGETAIAIGNALAEFRNTVSVGVVSGLSRSLTAGDEYGGASENLEGVIQTDAAINPGNSGGPLLDAAGQVIGMNVALVSGSQNIGFALPGNEVRKAVDSVIAQGRIVRAFLGVRYVPITADLVSEKKLASDYGILILTGATRSEPAITPGSPAAKAGLVAGDIILAIDGAKLEGDTSLASTIRAKNPGDTITLTILHNGVQKKVSATLAEMPNA